MLWMFWSILGAEMSFLQGKCKYVSVICWATITKWLTWPASCNAYKFVDISCLYCWCSRSLNNLRGGAYLCREDYFEATGRQLLDHLVTTLWLFVESSSVLWAASYLFLSIIWIADLVKAGRSRDLPAVMHPRSALFDWASVFSRRANTKKTFLHNMIIKYKLSSPTLLMKKKILLIWS